MFAVALLLLATYGVAATPADAVVVDLGDSWAPRLLEGTPEHPQPYRSTFVALANERVPAGAEWATARRDRHYELFGIPPSFSVIAVRLRDDPRHDCHAAVPSDALRDAERELEAAVRAAQAHLRCEGLLPPAAADGALDAATRGALAVYQRKHMLPSRAVLDEETRAALLTPSRELDFRALLRALRERVSDAAGIIEDGSALNAWAPVLGRHLDSREYRTPLRPAPLPGGAPDLVAAATEAAAIALGWTSPQAARAALLRGPPSRVPLPLPPRPPYYAHPLRLRAEIDRGDVWAESPLDESGQRRPSPVRRRPTLVLYAQTPHGDVPLVRWPTTIGGWQEERLPTGEVVHRFKESPLGRRYWRDLVAAPAWFPPPTTPDRELVHRRADGTWAVSSDAVGPGYRSAYGLMALFHFRLLEVPSPAATMADTEIRTHGSGNYRSILRGASHGCHRLFNHLAIRLGSYLLAHHETVRHGVIAERYARSVPWAGRRFVLRAGERGYRHELVPPIPVDVLPGRRVRSRAPAATPPAVAAGGSQPSQAAALP